MSVSDSYEIKGLKFNNKSVLDLQKYLYARELWPVIYVISDPKRKLAYVGETADTITRMIAHLANEKKKLLPDLNIISSNKFNKSATLDIESNLIKYLSGDGEYELLNGNLGLANHMYYQKKDVYWKVFGDLWAQLKKRGFVKHSIEQINNSDLFKFSPYKSLSEDQRQSLKEIIQCLINNKFKTTLVEGGAGTGKTILAIFLFKLLKTDLEDFNFSEFGEDERQLYEQVKTLKRIYGNPSVALVVPMESLRRTLSRIFKNIKGLRSNMVVGPADLGRNSYDIVIVDEAHRLRQRKNLGNYFGVFDKINKKLGLKNGTELDWVLKKGLKKVLFYDAGQTIKPSDVTSGDFTKLRQQKNVAKAILRSQFRVLGGTDYVSFIHNLFDCKLHKNKQFHSENYELVLFDDISAMRQMIRQRDNETGLSRMIAGFSWEWKSRTKKTHDIEIGNEKLTWNRKKTDWVNSPNAINEVGCIHTTQGYDLNYVGLVFGNEISYDPYSRKIIVNKEHYHDKNGKMGIKDPEELKSYILNIYKTMMLRGIKGTYIYISDKNLRDYFAQHIQVHSVQSAIKLFDSDEVEPFIDAIPFYNIKVAAGNFSEPNNVSETKWIKLGFELKSMKDYFVCKISGNSMNKNIPDGSYCLFKKSSGGSRAGQTVLVSNQAIQDADFGAGFTVKRYKSKKHIKDGVWEHHSIELSPDSFDPSYESILLELDESTELKVIGEFVKVIAIVPDYFHKN